MMKKFKYKNIDETGNKDSQRKISLYIALLFFSSCFVFLLLGFLKAEGGIVDKTKWLAKTLNPILYTPSLIGLLILTFIGYPFCLPVRKIFKEYTWLLAPIVGLAYWSLWILPSYIGLSFRLSLIAAILVVIIVYAVVWLSGSLKKVPLPKDVVCLGIIVFVVSVFHAYPYSQLGGLTSYSGTGCNDSFYYTCRSATLIDAPLSERLPYMTEDEKGKLYKSRSAESKRLKSVMGTAFLQASLTVFPYFDEVNAFPVLLILAVLLVVIGTYLASRFGFLMSYKVSLIAAALVGVNPYFFSIAQSAWLRHLTGVACLCPIFLMVVQGSLKEWRCFIYAAFFLLALYVNYTVISPLGGMIFLGVPSTVCFFIIVIWIAKKIKKIWSMNRIGFRSVLVLLIPIFLLLFSMGIFYEFKFIVGELVERIPSISSKIITVTPQEIFGLQPRPWMTKHKYSISSHGTLAVSLMSFSCIVFILGLIRLCCQNKKVLIAAPLGLYAIIGILGYAFHVRGDTYSEYKYWSYVISFVFIILVSGIFWLAEFKRGIIITFITLFISLVLLDINVANLYITGSINVAHSKAYNTYVDDELKRLPDLFEKVPENNTVFLGPMKDWDAAWAMYYGRGKNVTIDKCPLFYTWPRGKNGILKLLNNWTYRITTKKIPGKVPVSQEGRFYLYER